MPTQDQVKLFDRFDQATSAVPDIDKKFHPINSMKATELGTEAVPQEAATVHLTSL